MVRKNYRTLIIFLAIMLMLACAPVFVPAAPPTLDPNSINTVIAQTAGAAATQTAVLQPPKSTFTFTPLPSRTPSEVPSSTPTFIFILPTNTVPTSTPTLEPTSSGGGTGSCEVVSQDPEDNTEFSPGEDFDAFWNVRNTGNSTWDANSIDYRYISGAKIHQQAVYDLPNNVAAGRRINLGVDMTAPDESGTYTTRWQVRMGNTTLCTMRLTIIVN